MKGPIGRHNAIDTTDGVRPALQARSLKKRNSLLVAARSLMAERVFEDISIKDICAQASCTVGSFYSRFEDKASFFDALFAESCHEIMDLASKEFDGRDWSGVPASDLADHVVDFLVDIFQGEYSCVIREAFLRDAHGILPATAMRDFGFQSIDKVAGMLLPHVSGSTSEEARLTLTFGVQVVYGALFNARLRDAGPVKFGEPEFRNEMKRLFRRYLGLQSA